MSSLSKTFPAWNFEPKGSLSDDKFNGNEGEFLFSKGDSWDTLAREIIQNSLDASKNNFSEPVKVNFDFFTVSVNELPGGRDLEKIIRMCLNEDQINDSLKRDYEKGLKQFNRNSVSCLKITDENTSGLCGAIASPNHNTTNNFWYSLLHQIGKSEKSRGNSSGSMGVGKFAPFKFSFISTVLYATKLNGSEKGTAFQGIGRISSFSDGEKYYEPKITFSEEKKNNVYPPIHRELHYYDKYLPENEGTSVTVVCTNNEKKTEIYNDIRISVLSHFFIAIDKGMLEVEFGKNKITAQNLENRMSCFMDKSKLAYQQYYAYKNGTLISHKDKKIELRVTIEDFCNYKKVNLLKNQGMLIEDIKCGSSLKNIVGVCIVDDEDLCEKMKKLENAEHNKFVTKKEKDDTEEIKKIIDEVTSIKNWIKEEAEKLTMPEDETESELFGMDDITKVFSDDETEYTGKKNSVKTVFTDSKQINPTHVPISRKPKPPKPPKPSKDEMGQYAFPKLAVNGSTLKAILYPNEDGIISLKLFTISEENKTNDGVTFKEIRINDTLYEHVKNKVDNVSCQKGIPLKISAIINTDRKYRLAFKLVKEDQ